jgi:putative hydrolase
VRTHGVVGAEWAMRTANAPTAPPCEHRGECGGADRYGEPERPGHVANRSGIVMFAVGATLESRFRAPVRNHEHRPFVAITVAPMSNDLPFGFGPGSGGDPNQPGDFGGMQIFAQLQQLLSWQGGAVNWDLARQLAVQGLAGADADVPAGERKAVADAIHLADLWLDEVTELPSGVNTVESWTRHDWLEKTLPVWRDLCDPVAERVVAAMAAALPTGEGGDAEGEGSAAAMQMQALGPLGNMLPPGGIGAIMNQVGGLMFGAQVGQGLSGLAREVVASTDIGIPLGPSGVAALVPANVAAFGEGLERPADEVRLYLALREAAHQRLFSHVPWLRQRLLDTVAAYAQGISVDLSAIERAVGEVDPMNPQSMQDALSGGLFEPQTTPEQQAALRRLETLLALVEGWVDTVVAAAAGERMPGADALREASRRRRASGGPAEQTFATLVGLELRPRRLREAAALWWALSERHGISGRDGVWAHPDLLPTADDLDDPLGFAETVGAGEALTIPELDDEPGGQPEGKPEDEPEDEPEDGA